MTVVPMLVVATTTTTAAAEMLAMLWQGITLQWHNGSLTSAILFNSLVQAL